MKHDIILIAIVAFVTLITRALPFLFFNNRESKLINYLGEVLPYTIMPLLVVYCLKSVNFLTGNHGICEIIGVFTVIVLHLTKRNTLLSIFGGTIVYMLCVQLIFI